MSFTKQAKLIPLDEHTAEQARRIPSYWHADRKAVLSALRSYEADVAVIHRARPILAIIAWIMFWRYQPPATFIRIFGMCTYIELRMENCTILLADKLDNKECMGIMRATYPEILRNRLLAQFPDALIYDKPSW